MDLVKEIAWWLVFIGGINWLLVGLFKFDVVRTILPPGDKQAFSYGVASRVIYVLVGISAIILILAKYQVL